MAQNYLKSRKFKFDFLHILPLNYIALRTYNRLGMALISLKAAKFLQFFLSQHYKSLIGAEKIKILKLGFLFLSISYTVLLCSYIWTIVTAWDPWIPLIYF